MTTLFVGDQISINGETLSVCSFFRDGKDPKRLAFSELKKENGSLISLPIESTPFLIVRRGQEALRSFECPSVLIPEIIFSDEFGQTPNTEKPCESIMLTPGCLNLDGLSRRKNILPVSLAQVKDKMHATA